MTDYNGSWQGETEFQPNQGMYLFNLFNFQGNQAVYTEWLKRMEADINRIGNLSKTFDLPQNLLIWAGYQHKVRFDMCGWMTSGASNAMVCFLMLFLINTCVCLHMISFLMIVNQFISTSYQTLPPYVCPLSDEQEKTLVLSDGSYQDQTLSFDADARSIMWTDIITGSVADEGDECPEELSVKNYDRATGIMSIQFDTSLYFAEPACKGAVNPQTLGYDAGIDGDTFIFELDAYTLFAALTVAFDINGQNSLSLFQKIDNALTGVVFRGEKFDIARYYDPQNPQMDPMVCK